MRSFVLIWFSMHVNLLDVLLRKHLQQIIKARNGVLLVNLLITADFLCFCSAGRVYVHYYVVTQCLGPRRPLFLS